MASKKRQENGKMRCAKVDPEHSFRDLQERTISRSTSFKLTYRFLDFSFVMEDDEPSNKAETIFY